MKKHLLTLFNLILFCLLVFSLSAAGLPDAHAAEVTTVPSSTQVTAGAADPLCDSNRTIQVSGSASVKIVPDRVLVQIGVQSNASTIHGAQVTNNTTIQKVIRALQTAGIESKDISTDHYIAQPIYEDYTNLYIKGYRINNMVAVTLRDVDKTSEVIVSALEAGANQIANIQFYTSELRKYRDQARDLAVKAAKEKAQALAGAAGAQTGCVLRISENSRSYYNGWYGRDFGTMSQNVTQNAVSPSQGAQDDSGPVSLGQISVEATVDVTFALK